MVAKVDVAPLEDVRHLVDDVQLEREGILTVDVQGHLVIVAARETVAALTRRGDAAAVPQHGDVGQQGQAEQRQSHLPHDKEPGPPIAGGHHSDNGEDDNIESTRKKHFN